MKTKHLFFILLLAAVLAISCRSPISIHLGGGKEIQPSGVIVSEERDVGDFTGIDMRSFGTLILSQGDTESVIIKGSDNVVPVIQTSVRNGILVIQNDEDIRITGVNEYKVLTYTIVVKDLSSLTISGAADVEIGSLTTPELKVEMNGAGQVTLDSLTSDSLDITLSGVGNVTVSGEVSTARIDIPGAGSINAADLQIQTADVNISGIGSATVWVTDELSGNISGGGNVSYYGNPQTDTETTGLGAFKSLGDK